jgi:hypothetical protein
MVPWRRKCPIEPYPERKTWRGREHEEAEVEAEPEPRAILAREEQRRCSATSSCGGKRQLHYERKSEQVERRNGKDGEGNYSGRLFWRRSAAVGATVCHRTASASDVRPRGGEALTVIRASAHVRVSAR